MSGENVLLHSSNTEQADVQDDVEEVAKDGNEDIAKDDDEEVAKDGDEEVAKDDVENDVKNDAKDDVENDSKEEQDANADINSSLQDVEENIDREDNQHHVDDHTEEIVNNDINVEETINKTTVALEPTETKDDDVQIDSTSQQDSEESEEHEFLYRLLRPDEEFTRGILPKSNSSCTTVETHVASGSSSHIKSKYVSCSKSLESVKNFARGIRRTWRSEMRYIVEINRTLLGDDVEVIDLTQDDVRRVHLESPRSEKNAVRFDEILLAPRTRVPSASIKKIATVHHGTITMHQD